MAKEWKINNWFMKTLFVCACISGVITVLFLITGFIGAMLTP